jgi:hypothetical protein
MRWQFASVDGVCGSKNKMARISPICKKCKIFISYLKSPTYRDFMKKKIIKIQEIKISHLGTFKMWENALVVLGRVLIFRRYSHRNPNIVQTYHKRGILFLLDNAAKVHQPKIYRLTHIRWRQKTVRMLVISESYQNYQNGALSNHDCRWMGEGGVCRGVTVNFFFFGGGIFSYIFFILYSALLYLPPLRFHCADVCWDRTQNRCT